MTLALSPVSGPRFFIVSKAVSFVENVGGEPPVWPAWRASLESFGRPPELWPRPEAYDI